MREKKGTQKRLILELFVLHPGREYHIDDVVAYILPRFPPENAIRSFLRWRKALDHQREERDVRRAQSRSVHTRPDYAPPEYSLDYQVRQGLRRLIHDRFNKHEYAKHLTRRREGPRVYFSLKEEPQALYLVPKVPSVLPSCRPAVCRKRTA